MRIIGGEHRGRRIAAPEGQATRPMLDRVREALFSSSQDWLEDARVLDLFAGSGSLGLEALSRGAAHARMVEDDRRTVRLIKDNVASLGLGDRAEVICDDALAPTAWGIERADLVFFDPPYPLLDRKDTRERLFTALAALVMDVLAPDGLLWFHAPRNAVSERELVDLGQVRVRHYGTNALWTLRPPAREA